LALGVKAGPRLHPADLRGLTALADGGPVGRRLLVAGTTDPQMLADRFGQVEALPLRAFVEALWAGELLR
jgi:hypothetical protein